MASASAGRRLPGVASGSPTENTSGFGGGAHPATPEVENIVVIGCSGHARVIIDILEQAHLYQIIGLLDSFKPPETELLGYRVFGTEDDLPALLAAHVCDGGIIAIGDNWTRAKMVAKILEIAPEFRFISAIHPATCIAPGVSIGNGAAVMAGTVVNTGSLIGNFCILNTRSSVDHDCIIGDFVSLAPGVVTGGSVRIGSYSALAIGATISHEVSIGAHTVVGAGATAVRDIPDCVVAYGVPARVVRSRQPGDPYLGDPRQRTRGHDTARPPLTPSLPQMKLIPPTSADWMRYLSATEHDFFHLPGYHQLCGTFGGGEPWLAVYEEGSSFIAWPYLLQNIPSSSAGGEGLRDVTSVYGYTGPVWAGPLSSCFLERSWNCFVELWRAQRVVSVFTRFHPFLRNDKLLDGSPLSTAENPGFPYHQGQTVAIDIFRPDEEVRAGYTRQLRQALRRCDASGLRTSPDPDWAAMGDFVRLYYQTMKRNCASPFYFFPGEYFRRLKEELGRMGSLMVARVDGEIAAASLLIEFGNVASIHLLATGDRFAHLSPSKQVIDAAQRWARERGKQYLFLGGGRANRDDDPLFRFKAQFSRKLFPFFTGRWILDRDAYNSLVERRRFEYEILRGKRMIEGFFPAYRAPFVRDGARYDNHDHAANDE